MLSRSQFIHLRDTRPPHNTWTIQYYRIKWPKEAGTKVRSLATGRWQRFIDRTFDQQILSSITTCVVGVESPLKKCREARCEAELRGSPEWRYATGSWDFGFERLISNIDARDRELGWMFNHVVSKVGAMRNFWRKKYKNVFFELNDFLVLANMFHRNLCTPPPYQILEIFVFGTDEAFRDSFWVFNIILGVKSTWNW